MIAWWARNAGRVLCAGDSITLGYGSASGGWRGGLGRLLTDARVRSDFVGPYADAWGRHRGVSGDRADAQGVAFLADVRDAAPNLTILAYGTNDLGSGASALEFLRAISDVIDLVREGAPESRILVVAPLRAGYGTGAIPYYGRTPQRDLALEGLPTICAARGAAFLDLEAGGVPIVTSDGIHPIDGPLGYDAIAVRVLAGVLALTPGA